MKVNSCAEKAMKISAKARYALSIVLDVAANAKEGVLRRGAEIASAQRISEKFLSRIVLPLKENGILASVRGATGGFRLATEPARIKLIDIVQSVQGAFAILDCLKPGVKCPEECTCFARKIWGEINDSFVKTLSSHTVASMLKDKAAGLVKLGC